MVLHIRSYSLYRLYLHYSKLCFRHLIIKGIFSEFHFVFSSQLAIVSPFFSFRVLALLLISSLYFPSHENFPFYISCDDKYSLNIQRWSYDSPDLFSIYHVVHWWCSSKSSRLSVDVMLLKIWATGMASTQMNKLPMKYKKTRSHYPALIMKRTRARKNFRSISWLMIDKRILLRQGRYRKIDKSVRVWLWYIWEMLKKLDDAMNKPHIVNRSAQKSMAILLKMVSNSSEQISTIYSLLRATGWVLYILLEGYRFDVDGKHMNESSL